MIPFSDSLLDRLDLRGAALEIASEYNPLLPRTPETDQISERVEAFESWALARLRMGFTPATEVIVSTRKAGFGIRPFAIWGALEEVVYRALVDMVLAPVAALDRTQEAYRRFLVEPARHLIGGRDLYSRSYVVKTDVVSCYQFIDHGMLSEELMYVSGEKEAIDHLIRLLGEVQGRNFGIPQARQASHRLADVYLEIVDRNLIRRGLEHWRYSDDIRIVCSSYGAALQAIEDLDGMLRDVGLMMGEHKTSTPTARKFVSEVVELFGEDGHLPEEIQEDPQSVDTEDEYDEISTMDVDDAAALISSASSSRDGSDEDVSVDLTRLTGDEFRALRRAWNSLIAHSDPRGLGEVVRYFTFVPGLTAHICRYLSQMAPLRPKDVRVVADRVVRRVALTDWQRGWIVEVLRSLMREGVVISNSWVRWLEGLVHTSTSPWIRALALLCLAEVAPARTGFDEVEKLLRISSGALMPWYAAAARVVASGNDETGARLAALLKSTPTARWMSA